MKTCVYTEDKKAHKQQQKMDPLSVSSGIVGLLAFAVEMAKMASAAKKAVEQFKNAPKEVDELADKLALLETACKMVEINLEVRQGIPGATTAATAASKSPASFTVISTALTQCHKKMQGLRQALVHFGMMNGSDGQRSTGSKFSRVRFVLGREKVKSLVQDVGDAITLLQFVINIDIW